jgi:hypothetical protein
MIFSIQAKIDEKGLNIEVMDDAFVESFKKAVGGLAKSAQESWIAMAQQKLKSSRADYVKGLRQAESFKHLKIGGNEVFEIQLVGKMANNFEFGMSSYDMKAIKPGWLGGGKAKVGKDGKRYVVIPFGHSTSDSPSQAYTGKAAKANLKKELKKTVKQYGLDKLVRTASGKVVEGTVGRVKKDPSVHPFLQGLVKIQKGTSGATSSGLQRGSSKLMTFRVMSENSPADSWEHPGIKGANLLPDVERYVDNELDKIIDMILGV